MPGTSADPDEIRQESRRWFDLAEDMGSIRRAADALWLAITAFFPGGMTEARHHAKYRELLDAAVHRFHGAAVEFELIGMTLRTIATDYENDEQVTVDSFRISAEELQRATDTHAPPRIGPNVPV